MNTPSPIVITTTVNASPARVWTCWTTPEHICGWNQASADWHCPAAQNDLQPGGRFSFTMAARDGSLQFDFAGRYDEIIEYSLIRYTIDDGRRVEVRFQEEETGTRITETFDPENIHEAELQRQGWQAILNNFNKYVASQP
jgi:uncharacterized protein YndB with AHSA1/START domain